MGKLALLFPGQGAQYVGMLETLYRQSQVVRDTVDRACDLLDMDLKSLCFNGPAERLARTDHAQPVILTAGYAFYRLYMEEVGAAPAFLAGHSLGEITALVCAGVLDFKDALVIARARGLLMQEAARENPGIMLAVLGLDLETIETACRSVTTPGKPAAVANINTETQVVISGHPAAVREAGQICRSAGARLAEINVNIPFHCSLLASAARGMRNELKKYSFNPLQTPVVSNVTAMPYTHHHEVAFFLACQVTSPVRWHQGIEFFKRCRVDTLVEMGPNHHLTKMLKRSVGHKFNLYSYDIPEDRETLKNNIY